jgi:hypothetical protein
MRNPLSSNEHGAVLVHVGFMLAGLIAFSAFVTDYGILWVSRRQAQNAADASAHAGAVGLGFNDFNNRTDTGPAKLSAVNAGNLNNVWGAAASITAADVTFPVCPDGSNACVRAEVFRDAAHNNPLPTFFGKMVGVSSQNIRATATAEVFQTSVANCLKPWALIDRWQNNWENGSSTGAVPPLDQPGSDTRWTTDSKYDKYKQNGDLDPSVPAGSWDDYLRSRDGFTLYDTSNPSQFSTYDYGKLMTLKISQANKFNAGWFQALDLVCSGANCYRDAIRTCVAQKFSPLNPDGTCPVQFDENGAPIPCTITFETGNMVGPTDQGVTGNGGLCEQDPTANWDWSLNGGSGGVAGSNGRRTVQVPVMSPEDVSTTKNGKTQASIQAIIGLYVMCPGDAGYTAGNGEVQGRLIPVNGELSSTSGPNPNTFLVTVGIVR